MFWMDRGGKKPPLSMPLLGPLPSPNGDSTDPVLVLGVMVGIDEELGDVFRNDLVYSRTTQWNRHLPRELGDTVLLHILQFLEGRTLINLCKIYDGTAVVDDSMLYDREGNLKLSAIDALKPKRFRAIVVSDSAVSEEEEIREYVIAERDRNGSNIVVMAIEGLFNLGFMRDFGVAWRLVAYTKRSIYATEAGKHMLGQYAFPFESKYTKGNFVVGHGHELFAELVEDDSEDDDPPPVPQPGSPVIVSIVGGRCVSYFGFVNGLDVSYGAIILRLCYADQYVSGLLD
jgi:hypothetical protein